MCCNDSSLSFYLDGKNIKNMQRPSVYANNVFYVGNISDNDTNTPLRGYIDEIRFSNVLRFTEEFTPPTEPYTVYQNAQPGEIYVKESGTWKKILTGMK